MAKHTFPFVGTVEKISGFGKKSSTTVQLRDTKYHYVTKNGIKYKKSNGHSTSGTYYKGVFLGETLVLSSVAVGELG